MKISLLGPLSQCRIGSKPSLLRLARELGVSGLELVDDQLVTGADVPRIRADLENEGIEPISLHIPVKLAAPGHPSGSANLEIAGKSLERAALLGVRKVMLAPLLSATEASSPEMRIPFEEMVTLLMPTLRRLSLQPTFNNSGNYAECFGQIAYCIRLCQKFGPNAGVTFDVGNLLLAGEEQELATEQLTDWISVVHLKDWVVVSDGGENPTLLQPRFLLYGLKRWLMKSRAAGLSRGLVQALGLAGTLKRRSRLFQGMDGAWYEGAIVGEGIVDHEAFLKQLHQIGYRGYVSIEYEGVGDLKTAYKRGVERVRRILENSSTGGPIG